MWKDPSALDSSVAPGPASLGHISWAVPAARVLAALSYRFCGGHGPLSLSQRVYYFERHMKTLKFHTFYFVSLCLTETHLPSTYGKKINVNWKLFESVHINLIVHTITWSIRSVVKNSNVDELNYELQMYHVISWCLFNIRQILEPTAVLGFGFISLWAFEIMKLFSHQTFVGKCNGRLHLKTFDISCNFG